MPVKRAIAVLLLALGFALSSVVGVALATEQAFAKPCPMQHQSDDCPCCKGDCTGPMMGCATKCSPSGGASALPDLTWFVPMTSAVIAGFEPGVYSPFITGPPPKIPIV